MNAEKTQEIRNLITRKRMLKLQAVRIGKLPADSPWLRPVRVHYTQDGQQKIWDVIREHNSVCIVVYNRTREKLVFVRQFRPACYCSWLPEGQEEIDVKQFPPSLGLTLELCGGIVDKDKPIIEIARDELKEECGYEAPASAFTKIISYRFESYHSSDMIFRS